MPKTVKDTYVRNAKMLSVIDGDTVDLNVDLGFDLNIKMRCRLDGINAPEKNTAAGKAAKARVLELTPLGADVVVQTVKDRKEKYGRYLATVFLPGQTTSINDLLIAEGHAVEYHGEARG